MNKIDNSIITTSAVICENIARFDTSERGLLSQNILSQLRNLVEYIAIKIFSSEDCINPNDYDINKSAMNNLMRNGKLRFLYDFHEMLQKSVSHYTVDKDGSERLMLKYYEYLLRIKKFLADNYSLEILENIDQFPLNTDEEMEKYYSAIAEKVNNPTNQSLANSFYDRYYILKIRPFFVEYEIFYEVTFTRANDKVSKFDRLIAFTKYDISENYAVRLTIYNDSVKMIGREMSILIISEWSVYVRPCEFGNLSKIFGHIADYNIKLVEYQKLMNFLTNSKMTLTELVSSDSDYYNRIKSELCLNESKVRLFRILDISREIIVNSKSGENILRYLLHKINNRVIKDQLSSQRCYILSDLFLKFKCIPFEKMPFCTSLCNHNPRMIDLLNSIPIVNREHEIFARYIKNNTEIDGKLFTSLVDIENFNSINEMISKYNRILYEGHEHRKLKVYKEHIYIDYYATDCQIIMKKLKELSSSGVSQYQNSVESWLSLEQHDIDDSSKKDALKRMFVNSHVTMVYGSAGTGKSTLIRHISTFWSTHRKIYLANTHPAVDNLRRRVNLGESIYSTIAKFVSSSNIYFECDILIIDECSTVSNKDMRSILEKAKFKLLVLVGDTFQIESITFGNWFNIARMFIQNSAVIELENPYRARNKELLVLWERVRKLSDSILESFVKFGITTRLDETIFEHSEGDEVVLCLNYDGLYGINNINRFIQNSNPNKAYKWETYIYKVNDPVLFNESQLFSPLIHNNSKGRITNIHLEGEHITFSIELDKSINEIDASRYSFNLEGVSSDGNSIISFTIFKKKSTDEDDDTHISMTTVPFQIAYAISIHKAQGLEYDSVKVVVTNEIEERITHNIFYTAITRAKSKLRIYWSPETEREVLARFRKQNSTKDAYLLSNLYTIDLV